MSKLSPREEARRKGENFYYSNSPCKRGHSAKRRVDSGQCTECATIRRKKIYHEQKKDCLTFNQLCSVCGDFTSHYGSNGNCKQCANRRSKSFHEANRSDIILSMREYYNKNKDDFKRYKQDYYKKNKDIILDKCKTYREKNQEKIKSYRKRPESLRRHRNRQKRFLSTDDGKLSQFIRNSIHRTLNNKNGKKSFELVGYTKLELKNRIESTFLDGMSWSNYGDWHIDHIIPLSALVSNGVTCVKVINSLSNLQAMWAKDNISKHCHYDGDIKQAIKEITNAA